RMSMSIPFFYEMISDGARQFVDGGIISNFPLWLFDEERLSSASGISVVGFELREPAAPSIPIVSWRQYAFAIVNTVMRANQRLLEITQRVNRRANIISISTGDVSATDFHIKPATVEWLYQQGASAARLFFATQAVGAPEPVAGSANGRDAASIRTRLNNQTLS